MSRTWTFVHVLVLIAVVLFLFGFVAAMAWTDKITNALAWGMAGLAVFAASKLPWRPEP